MTNDEVQRTMDFILAEQAKVTVGIEQLLQTQAAAEVRSAKADERIARLERLMALTIRAGRRERKELRDRINALVDAQTHTEDVLTELMESTDQKFAALADSQIRLEQSQREMQQAMAELSRIVARHDQQLNNGKG